MAPDPKQPADSDDKEDAEPTPLAKLAALAKERMGPEPDYVTPAALKTFAAIVRDLKGMPELLVTREHTHRLRLGRRGKVGALGLEYRPNIRAIELSYLNWPGTDPTSIKMYRYTFDQEKGPSGEWHRMDDGGEFIDDVQQAIAKLYPEIAT